LVVEQLSGRPPGRLPDHDPAHRGNRLQAGGGVDHIASDHTLPGLRPSAQRDNRLARADPDPYGQLKGSMDSVQVLDRLEDSQGRPYRPLRVVLVRNRRTEHGHDGITDELLYRAA
jgi:hypothetical protein